MTEPRSLRLEDAVVENYLSEIRRTDAGIGWAYSVMNELCHQAPDLAWPILLALVARAPDDLIDQIAAGPIEDFLVWNGAKVIELVEAQAERDARFRWVLRGVWQQAMPDEIWTRVLAASRPHEAGPGEYDPPRIDDTAGSPYRTTKLEVAVEGLPPASPDDPAGAVLTASILELEFRPDLPIEVPVRLTLTVQPEPDLKIPPVATFANPTIDVLVDAGILATQSLVWDLECIRLTESTTRYTVSIHEMSEEQVEALSTVSPEWTADSVQEILDQARSMFPDVEWPDWTKQTTGDDP